MLVAESSGHAKALLTLYEGKQSGAVDCAVNVRLLVGAEEPHPHQMRFLNWEYTLDGGQTFLALPPTTRATTRIGGLTPLTTVGVRVSLYNSTGAGPWSQVVSILVR